MVQSRPYNFPPATTRPASPTKRYPLTRAERAQLHPFAHAAMGVFMTRKPALLSGMRHGHAPDHAITSRRHQIACLATLPVPLLLALQTPL